MTTQDFRRKVRALDLSGSYDGLPIAWIAGQISESVLERTLSPGEGYFELLKIVTKRNRENHNDCDTRELITT